MWSTESDLKKSDAFSSPSSFNGTSFGMAIPVRLRGRTGEGEVAGGVGSGWNGDPGMVANGVGESDDENEKGCGMWESIMTIESSQYPTGAVKHTHTHTHAEEIHQSTTKSGAPLSVIQYRNHVQSKSSRQLATEEKRVSARGSDHSGTQGLTIQPPLADY